MDPDSGRDSHKMLSIIWVLLPVAAAVVSYALFARPSFFNLLIRRRNSDGEALVWEDRGPTPLGEKGYTPQGMTWVGDRIVFANSWKNKKSRIYEIDPETMVVLRHFDMPVGAVHTSGLAWDGRHLWGVDFISNRGYCIDLEPSLASGQAGVVGSFDTTLKGTSACCIVPWNGEQHLAISDFMTGKRTIFVRMRDAVEEGTAANAIDFEYRNEGFSQGLEFIEGFLYESENKFGIDIINKIDLKVLSKTRSSRKATVAQYRAPSKGVEDLAWSGKYLWTSDETVFRFFRGTFG